MATINLGDRAKDKITGFTGICTGRFLYLNGCVRIELQPEKLKDGAMQDGRIIDEAQLELVKRAVLPAPNQAPGGPRDAPKYYQTPAR